MWIFGGDGFDDDDDECGLLIGGMNDGGQEFGLDC